MELLLELRVGHDPDAVRLDCRVDVDTDATLAELRRALADHAVERDVVVHSGARLWDDDGQALPDDHLVAGAGLRSGRRVWLAAEAPPRRPRPAPDNGVVADASGGIPYVPSPVPPVPLGPRWLPPVAAPPSHRQGRRRFRAARADYLGELERRAAEVAAAVEEDRAARHRALPQLGRLVDAAALRRPPLWAFGRDDPGFLTVRLGTGDDASRVRIDVEDGGDPRLRRLAADRVRATAAAVSDVPVPLDLDASVGVGLEGEASIVDGLARSLLGQLLARHGPDDMVVAALVAPPAVRAYEWLRWVPHVRSPSSPLAGEHLAVWPQARDQLLGGLLEVASRAEGGTTFPRIVLLVDQEAIGDPSRLDALMDAAGPAGIRALWVARAATGVPRWCATQVRVEAPDSGTAADADGGRPVPFAVETVEVSVLDRLARHLAPLRDASSPARSGSLPRVVGLADVLGGTPAPADVASAWSLSDGGLVDAPVGLAADGTLVLDLVEHGPHCIVAGAAGSGRRELLRSWVSALAARHPPERLTFLFVGLGDGTGVPVPELPHDLCSTGGADGEHLLASLPVELDRRAELLSASGREDLATLAAADRAACPPRLLVVVDAPAGTSDADPGVRAALLDVVTRGGPAGVHLLIATEQPAAVEERILRDADLRVALRMAERDGSRLVVGVDDATGIPASLPGRALARTSTARVVPFQSAWSGAPRRPVAAGRVRVDALGFGRRADARAASPGRGVSQADGVLRAIVLAFQRSGREVPLPGWAVSDPTA